MTKSILRTKSYDFALKIISLVKELQFERKEFILSKQIMRSGTSIGALIREAEYAQSHLDFIHKLSIGLKEANETFYWLCLMEDALYIEKRSFEKLKLECNELISMLIASIKTMKAKR